MPESIESVKHVITELRDWAKNNREGAREPIGKRMDGYADQLEIVRDELIHLSGLTTALPPDIGNVYDLPPELLEELSIAKIDELEDQIVTVINASGGEASLDQILVGLFRKFKVSQKRRFLQNKLYRMSMVWSVEGRKGVYTITRPNIQPDEIPDEDPFAKNDASDMDSEIPF